MGRAARRSQPVSRAGAVLGVDPGLTRCGWGVLECGRGRFDVVAHGVIGTDPGAGVGDRLRVLADEIEAVIASHQPSTAAVERVLFNANVRTAMNTGQAAGVVLLALARAGIEVAHYTPPQVKAATTSYGAADKAQMRRAITKLLSLRTEPPADAADALALAFCHATAGPVTDAIADATAASSVGRSRYEAAVSAAVAADEAAARERNAANRNRSASTGAGGEHTKVDEARNARGPGQTG